jgi:hypothetical protein
MVLLSGLTAVSVLGGLTFIAAGLLEIDAGLAIFNGTLGSRFRIGPFINRQRGSSP